MKRARILESVFGMVFALVPMLVLLPGLCAAEAEREGLLFMDVPPDVTIATRLKTSIEKAPSMVSVVTEEDIRRGGYRTLTEIITSVPGFEPFQEPLEESARIAAARGVVVVLELRVKFMVDGHTVVDPASGFSYDILADYPVENISRVEIIRGPGSAMYGENAFLAVINIITKGAEEGVRVSAGFGTFNTREASILAAGRLGGLDASAFLHYKKTDGINGVIESDFQSIFDSIMVPLGYPAFTQTPGRIHAPIEAYDLSLKASNGEFYVNSWASRRRWSHMLSEFTILVPGNHTDGRYLFLEAGYRLRLGERAVIKPRAYVDRHDVQNTLMFTMPGATMPWDQNGDSIFDSYPDGYREFFKYMSDTAGVEAPVEIRLSGDNTLLLGVEYRATTFKWLKELTNVDPVTDVPYPSMQDVTQTKPFLRNSRRDSISVYAQDSWDITERLNLTAGVRHDSYSDFGNTTNPRVGVTWEFADRANLKLLYGEAFRAPTVVEMFHGTKGNNDLKPERIRTFEAGVSGRLGRRLGASVNYFDNRLRDIIRIASTSADPIVLYRNVDRQRSSGIEAEARYNWSRGDYLTVNYTHLDTEDGFGHPLPFVAKHKGNVALNFSPMDRLNAQVNAFVSGKRTRERDDSRPPVEGYAVVNLTATAKDVIDKGVDLQASVYNVFDESYSDPGSLGLPSDVPMPGRTFFVRLGYGF